MNNIAFIFMFINAVFYSLSFFAKSKIQLLLLQIASSIFFALQYLVVGAYTGAIVVTVDIFRLVVFSLIEKYKNSNPLRICAGLFFISVSIFCAILTWDKWFSVLPLLATISVIISLIINNLLVIKIIGLLSCPLQLIYMLFIKSYLNLVIEAIIILTQIIAITIDIVRLKKQRSLSA